MSIKELNDIFTKYKCDKGSNVSRGHNYQLEYGKVLSKVRDKKINILEIGIWKGISMKCFHEYMPNAQLYGIDIFTRIEPEDVPILKLDRTHYIKGDSMSDDIVTKIKNEWGDIKFDIIIDDGKHTPHANKMTFKNIMRFLKDNGIYYIEDVFPMDSLNIQEINNSFIQSHSNDLNISKFNDFLESISQYPYDRLDFRSNKTPIDSYIFKIRNKI